MKKILLIFTIAIAFASVSNAQLRYPFSTADFRTSTDSLTSSVAEVWDNLTYIDYATLDTNMTVTATIGSEIKDGAILYLEFTADGTNRTVTFSTGLTGASETITANKTDIIGFVYNGSAFKKFVATQVD